MFAHIVFMLSTDTCSFFDEVERIADPNYIPIESDVLRARTKTTGIYETRFTMGQLSIQYVRFLKRASCAWANMKQHVRRRRTAKRAQEMDTLFRKRHINHLLRSTERIRSSAVRGKLTSRDTGRCIGTLLTRAPRTE
jgi:hypothetical protein